MIQRIKNWFKNRKRKQTLEIIKQAKQVYLDGKECCMCFSFMRVEDSFLCYKDIVKRIPEFTPDFFGANKIYLIAICYWWPIEDRQSRIKAFNKLIEIYSK